MLGQVIISLTQIRSISVLLHDYEYLKKLTLTRPNHKIIRLLIMILLYLVIIVLVPVSSLSLLNKAKAISSSTMIHRSSNSSKLTENPVCMEMQATCSPMMSWI